MSAQATFDPVVFKQTTRRQWQEAADAWHRWGEVIGRWLDASTTEMIGLARVGEGSRVLDVAAGAGEQTLRIARQVGPTGSVLATDIAPDLLARAEADAAAAGLTNVSTRELDGEDTGSLDAASFDAAVSRVGLIYFPDRARALAGIHHVLRPGGRVAAVTYSTPDRNGFFAVPVGIIRDPGRAPRAGARPAGPVLARWAGRPRAGARRRGLRRGRGRGPSRRRCAWARPPSASGSRRSPSAPSTRCSPGWSRPSGRTSGPRSRTPCAGSRDRTGSWVRARCWWVPRPVRDGAWRASHRFGEQPAGRCREA